MYRLLILSVGAAAVAAAHAVSPAGHFQQRLLELQRHGSCMELPQFGVSTHQGRNPDDVNLRLISEIQAKVVRVDIPWVILEQHGQYDFGPFDTFINELRQAGKKIILVLAYGHPAHSDGPAPNGFPLPPHNADQRAAYGEYAVAVAQRYHGPGIVYEIWNEPNMDLFWPPAFNAKAYGDLLSETAIAIRKVVPNATILPAGLANENDPRQFLHALAAAGDLDPVDGINFHPYRFEGPENSLYDMAQLQSAAAGAGDRPLWITEWGYSEAWPPRPSADTRKRQAVMIARLMLIGAWAKAKTVLIYDLIDDGQNKDDVESQFGMFDFNFQPKPAAAAFKTIATLMSGCDTYDFSADPKRGVLTATFSSQSESTAVIWTYRPKGEQVYCFNSGRNSQIELHDIISNNVPISSCDGKFGIKLTLSDSVGPLLVKTKRIN